MGHQGAVSRSGQSHDHFTDKYIHPIHSYHPVQIPTDFHNVYLHMAGFLEYP